MACGAQPGDDEPRLAIGRDPTTTRSNLTVTSVEERVIVPENVADGRITFISGKGESVSSVRPISQMQMLQDQGIQRPVRDTAIVEFDLRSIAGFTFDSVTFELTLDRGVTPLDIDDFPFVYGKPSIEDGIITVDDDDDAQTSNPTLYGLVPLGHLPGFPTIPQAIGTVYRVDVSSFLRSFVARNGAASIVGFVVLPGCCFNSPGDEFFFTEAESGGATAPKLRFNRTVIVQTNAPPIARCAPVEVCADSSCGADANIDAGSYDPDGNAITIAMAPTGPYPIGTTHVVLSVHDGEFASTCSSEVVVRDCAPPTIVCSANRVEACARFSGKEVDVEAVASDACDRDVDLSNSRTGAGGNASDLYSIGTSTVVFAAVDDGNNAASCVTSIRVDWTIQSFALYSGSRDIRIGENAAIDGDVFAQGRVVVHEGAGIDGTAFARGRVRVEDRAIVRDGIYADGSVECIADCDRLGTVPASLPPNGAPDVSSYRAEIDRAREARRRDRRESRLELAGATIFVRGDFVLMRGGVVSGPGRIVATGDIRIEADGAMGDDIALVAGDAVVLRRRVHIGRGSTAFSGNDLRIEADVTMDSAVLLATEDMRIGARSTVVGFAWAGRDVHVAHHAVVTGEIVAAGDIAIGDDARMTHDCAALEVAPALGPVAAPSRDERRSR